MQVTHDNDCPYRGGRDCECGFDPNAIETLRARLAAADRMASCVEILIKYGCSGDWERLEAAMRAYRKETRHDE